MREHRAWRMALKVQSLRDIQHQGAQAASARAQEAHRQADLHQDQAEIALTTEVEEWSAGLAGDRMPLELIQGWQETIRAGEMSLIAAGNAVAVAAEDSELAMDVLKKAAARAEAASVLAQKLRRSWVRRQDEEALSEAADRTSQRGWRS